MNPDPYVPVHLRAIPAAARPGIRAAAKAAAATARTPETYPLSSDTKESLRVLLRRSRPAERSKRAA